MESRATAILLMLSLVAVLLVGAAVADDIIRLPSHAVGAGTSTLGCCNDAKCTQGGYCYCKDEFEDNQCAGAGATARTCNSCKPVNGSNPARFMCRDASWGYAPPTCK